MSMRGHNAGAGSLLSKKVLVLEADQVFGGAVVNLIANQDKLAVSSLRIKPHTDLLKELRKRSPDVVVVDDSIFPAISSSLFPLLQQFPDLKIVVVCTENNTMEVYTKHQLMISRSKDFLDIL
jgi:hypothetical protein